MKTVFQIKTSFKKNPGKKNEFHKSKQPCDMSAVSDNLVSS